MRERRRDFPIEQEEARRFAALDDELADHVRTGLNVWRVIFTGVVAAWIIFWVGIGLLLLLVGEWIATIVIFCLTTLPAALYVKRSMRLLMEPARKSHIQAGLHEAFVPHQQRLDEEEGLTHPGRYD